MTELETKLLKKITLLEANIESLDTLIEHYRTTIEGMESAQPLITIKVDDSTLTAIHLRKVTPMTWTEVHSTLNLTIKLGTLKAQVSDYQRELAHAHRPRTLGKDWFTSALTLKAKGLSNTAIANELGVTRRLVAQRFTQHRDRLCKAVN